jgi:hypothetical protein
MEEQEKQEKNKKLEIEGAVIDHFSKIKDFSETGISIMNKPGKTNMNDKNEANKLTDQIFREIDIIRDLLFDLEDLEESKSI